MTRDVVAPATVLPDPWQVPTVSVEEAGRLVYGIARAGAYAAVKRGDMPVLRIGRRQRVATSWLYERLALPMPARPTR